jgi:hypothetical protein
MPMGISSCNQKLPPKSAIEPVDVIRFGNTASAIMVKDANFYIMKSTTIQDFFLKCVNRPSKKMMTLKAPRSHDSTLSSTNLFTISK